MPYTSTFDRDKEIDILTRFSAAQKTVSDRRVTLARARKALKNAHESVKSIKRELFICRYGDDKVDTYKAKALHAGKARLEQIAERKKQQAGTPVTPPQITGCWNDLGTRPMTMPPPPPPPPTVVAPIQGATQPLTPDVPPGRCGECGTVITLRGLCGCVGKRHRALRVIVPGPSMEIKHPPVPAYEMGKEQS